MTHPILLDPENVKAYQTLCDCPRGTTRAWAAEAGWTYSRMRTFLENLQRHGLAEVHRVGNVRVFKGLRESATHCEGLRGSATPYLGSKSNSDKVPRYVEKTGEKEGFPHDPDAARLISALNDALSHRFDEWQRIPLDNYGSVAAARKILAVVPIDRAEQLVAEAGRIFTPDKTGGDLPRSLGHPFFVKYAINEWRRIQRELEQGQLSILFLDRGEPEPEQPPPAPPAQFIFEPDARSLRLMAGDVPVYDWRAVRDAAAGKE